MAVGPALGKRIVFTGGSGIVGRHVVNKLLSYGHEILNVDMTPLNDPRVHTLKADLTDGAQAFNSLSCHFQISQPFPGPPKTPDAVIHFAGIPQPVRIPDNECYRINVMGSYNILEAAAKLGIKKVILASSITTYGVTYADGDHDFPHYPLTEDSPTNPMDVYATSKVIMERTAQSFARRFPDVDIYALRIGAVIPPDQYEAELTNYLTCHEAEWKAHLWSYTDARDLGQMCHLGLMKNGLGYQVFNAVNDEIARDEEDTQMFLKRVVPHTEIVEEIRGREAPMLNRKIREVLGFKEEYGWRDVLKR